MDRVKVKNYGLENNKTITSSKMWTNVDNDFYFYNKVPVDVLRSRSILGGLETCCDLDLLDPYIKDAGSILEVGAGYGRVIAGLINRKFLGKIVGIERSTQFCKYLQENFAHKAEFWQTDLLDFKTSAKFDLILWLWCGISDFHYYQQAKIIQYLSSCLMQNGLLIIDTFPHLVEPSGALTYQNQFYAIEEKGYVARGYIPSAEEIRKHANFSDLKIMHHLQYKTSTGKERLLHFLIK